MTVYCYALTSIGVPGDMSWSEWKNNFDVADYRLTRMQFASFSNAIWSPTLGARVQMDRKLFYAHPDRLAQGFWVLQQDATHKTKFVFMKHTGQDLDYVAGTQYPDGTVTLSKGSTLNQKPLDDFFAHLTRLENLKKLREQPTIS